MLVLNKINLIVSFNDRINFKNHKPKHNFNLQNFVNIILKLTMQ